MNQISSIRVRDALYERVLPFRRSDVVSAGVGGIDMHQEIVRTLIMKGLGRLLVFVLFNFE